MKHTDKSTLTEQQQEFWLLIRKINLCWLQGQPSDLSTYFHQNVVFNSPDFKHQITGKENCIQTYIDFKEASTVLNYAESEPSIQIFEKTVIVAYRFEMEYEQKGNACRETGTDILAFEKEGRFWKVIWRALSNLKNI